MASPSPSSASSEARVITPASSRYLQQLCKHFAHKLTVSHDERHGRIEFSAGVCELNADGAGLTMKVSASEDTALPVLEDVVERHLKRFAFREALEIRWSRQAASSR
jgi:uncharacterized protein